MDPTALCCRTAADLPLLLPCEDQVEPPLLHNKSSLRGASHTTALTRALLLPASRGVAAVAKDSFATRSRGVAAVAQDSFATRSRGVAAVAKDSFATCSRGVAAVAKDAATTKYLPFRACQGRILLEAGSAKF